MSPPSEVESIVRDAFEDVALLIGGAASLHHLEDELVRTLIRRLEGVRGRALARLKRAGSQAAGATPSVRPHPLHPAVEGFLHHTPSGDISKEVKG